MPCWFHPSITARWHYSANGKTSLCGLPVAGTFNHAADGFRGEDCWVCTRRKQYAEEQKAKAAAADAAERLRHPRKHQLLSEYHLDLKSTDV